MGYTECPDFDLLYSCPQDQLSLSSSTRVSDVWHHDWLYYGSDSLIFTELCNLDLPFSASGVYDGLILKKTPVKFQSIKEKRISKRRKNVEQAQSRNRKHKMACTSVVTWSCNR